MKKVITYGTYDLFHEGHVKLLERAKKLGDYLIVAVTSDDFDRNRGKINVKQSLLERVQAVKDSGLADLVIVEEYVGQKIDDILKYNVDVFTVGDDWKGKFDYLSNYCEVVYLERTKNVSSSMLRDEQRKIKMGFVGSNNLLKKVITESSLINGTVNVSYYDENNIIDVKGVTKSENYMEFLSNIDAVYISSDPSLHYYYIKEALLNGKHVLCESPIVLNIKEYIELKNLAKKNNLVMMEAIKTAFSTAYNRLILMLKSKYIGEIVSIDATCTSLEELQSNLCSDYTLNSISDWGPTALLPIFQLLGTNYLKKDIISYLDNNNFDLFTRINFLYDNASASVKFGKGVKSEGTLVISGTKGYVYVPAPWWKTDYYEVRYENENDKKRFYYQLDGEGIRMELLSFIKSIFDDEKSRYIDDSVTAGIINIFNDFYNKTDFDEIKVQPSDGGAK